MGADMLLAAHPNPMPATAFDLTTYYPIFLYLVACILIPIGAIVGSYLVGPRKKTAVKLMPYESGMDPIGEAMHKYDVKFYLIAILFLVFDVELLFLYPWAVYTYGPEADPAWRASFGRIVFVEMLVFIATLVVAYVYAWRKGVFKWR
jgi:NADH-quinone oxidoreductase subunit A